MPSTERTWESIIHEIDPDYGRVRDHHYAYQFGSGRRFEDNAGSAQFLARLAGIALTDRDDASVWFLENDDAGHVTMTNPVPAGFVGETFAAYDGPMLRTPTGVVRILVRGARLGCEIVAGAPDGRRIYAPEAVNALIGTDTIYEIVVPAGYVVGGVLGYETAPTVT